MLDVVSETYFPLPREQPNVKPLPKLDDDATVRLSDCITVATIVKGLLDEIDPSPVISAPPKATGKSSYSKPVTKQRSIKYKSKWFVL